MKQNLRDRAILVHCRISQWNGSKRNQKESEELCNRKGASEDAATVIINYIPKATLKSLRAKANRVRSTFMEWTRPWLDGGVRILARENLPKYDEAIEKAISDYNTYASRWIRDTYPTILQQMPKRLSRLLDNHPMPTAIQLLSRFQIQHSKFPVPDANDIQNDKGENNTLKQQVTDSIRKATKRTVVDIWVELTTLISKVKESLGNPDKTFKDSLIKNLQTFCERIPTENFNDDTQLEEARQNIIKQLASIDPQDLRENKSLRKSASQKATEILQSIRKIDLDLD